MASPLVFDPLTLPIGFIGKAHGTRGHVNLRLFNESGRSLSQLKFPAEVVLETPQGSRKPTVVLAARFVHDHYLLHLEGVDDRDAASALNGQLLRISRAQLPPIQDDEFYRQDLIGCRVVDQNDNPLGTLSTVFDNGAHGVAVIAREDGEELMLPLLKPFLLEVDVPGRFLRFECLPEEDLNDSGLQGREP